MLRRYSLLLGLVTFLAAGCGDDDNICPGGAVSCGQLCDATSAPTGCGDSCDISTACPTGLYCGLDGTCTADCASDGDSLCPDDACTADGRCVDVESICPDGSLECGQACEDVADAGAGNNLCGAPCAGDGDCGGGYYCSAASVCTQDCSASNDEFCPVGECDSDGHCVDTRSMDAGNICARQSVEATRVTPNVIFVIDRSGSMAWELDISEMDADPTDCPWDSGANGGAGAYDCYDSGSAAIVAQSRWHELRTALVGTSTGVAAEGLIGQMQDQVRFGAALYRRGGGSCYNMNNLTPVDVMSTEHIGVVDVGAANLAREVIAGDGSDNQYLDLDPGGGTPTGAAIDWTVDNLDPGLLTSPDPTIFILATDGAPTDDSDCNSHPNQEGAEAWSVSAVQRAHSAGVRTFVLAVADESQLNQSHVDDLANAGLGLATNATPAAESWRITSVAALNTALNTIIQGEISCTVDLQGSVTDWAIDPCSGGSVTIVEEGGARIPVLCEPTNGWELISENQLRLNGASCNTLKASPGSSLDASFPCNTVIIIE